MKPIFPFILKRHPPLHYVLFSLFISCIFYSCRQNKKIIGHASFMTEYDLTSDSVKTMAIFDILYKTICKDYLVISSYKAKKMLHFYSIPDLTYQFSLGERGRGANEFQTYPTFCRTFSGDLLVRGYTPYVIKQLRVEKDTIITKKEFKLKIAEIPNQMHLLYDSLLYYMDYSSRSIKAYNFTSQKNILEKNISSNKNGLSSSLDIDNGSFMGNNKTSIYAYQYKKEIEFYNTSDLTHRFTLKWDYTNQESILTEENINNVVLHYTGGCATENNLFILYRGYTPFAKKVHSHIEMYDNDGKPVALFNLDKKIFSFVVDEKNKMFYCFGENDDYIFRYSWKTD